MKRLFTTTALLALMIGTAHAGDPVRLLTSDNSIAVQPAAVLDQAMPPVVAKQPDAEPVQLMETARKAGPDKVELAALYYYADQKQENRVEAELRRLKHKYPGFLTPKDLYLPEAARGAVDEKILWALYDKSDIAGIEAEMARRVKDIPGWQATDDFSAKFARKKVRVTIENATKAKDWAGVIAMAGSIDPQTEAEPDLLWNLIDAYSATGNKEALASTYRAMLLRDAGHPLSKPVIIATIQKATRDFTPEDIRAVMARFASDPVISAGLTGVSTDLIRKAVAGFNSDEKQTVALPKEDIATLAAAASKDQQIADFSLLGWYFIKVKEPADAGAWFKRALEKEQSVEHAKGLYLSLVQQERQEEAYQLALKYKDALAADPVFLMNALAERFTKPDTGAIDAEAVKAYSGTILATKSGDHAEILAWYAYNSGQYQASRAWFSKAFAWEPEKVRLKGMALSQAQLNDRQGLIALYKKYGQQFPDIWDDIHLNKSGKIRKTNPRRQANFIDEMKVGAVDPEIVEEPVRKPKRRAVVVEETETSQQPVTRDNSTCTLSSSARSADQALSQGWCLLKLNRMAEAKQAFSMALAGNGKTRADAAYGLSLTLLRGKLTDEAESVASLYPMETGRDQEIRAEIYWQKARSSFDHKQFQQTLNALNARIALKPEPVNMTQLRAWSHFNLGHMAEARAIFLRLSQQMDDPAVRRGLTATSSQASISKR